MEERKLKSEAVFTQFFPQEGSRLRNCSTNGFEKEKEEEKKIPGEEQRLLNHPTKEEEKKENS